MRTAVKLINASAPLWYLSEAKRYLSRDSDGVLRLSGFPIEAVEEVGETVILYSFAGRWWSIRRADYERVNAP